VLFLSANRQGQLLPLTADKSERASFFSLRRSITTCLLFFFPFAGQETSPPPPLSSFIFREIVTHEVVELPLPRGREEEKGLSPLPRSR